MQFNSELLVKPGVTLNSKGKGISLWQIIKRSNSLNLLATATFLNLKTTLTRSLLAMIRPMVFCVSWCQMADAILGIKTD